MGTEEPKFSLVIKDSAFELRDFAATVVAEVTVKGTQDEASRRGFRVLAGYIFGANARRQKIAMTAPVTQIGASGEWRVRFTMPSKHRFEDLPLPNDPDVSLHAEPMARLAVLRFSGLAGEAKVAEVIDRLLAWVASRGLVVTGPSQISRYDPPWTLWFLRRNEVMVPVTAV